MSLFDKLQSNRKAKIDEEKAAGAAFLAENKKRENIIELPNGIQYEIPQAHFFIMLRMKNAFLQPVIIGKTF